MVFLQYSVIQLWEFIFIILTKDRAMKMCIQFLQQ